MMDWLGKLLDLPKEFLACSGDCGGGVIQVHFIDNFRKNRQDINIWSCKGKRPLGEPGCRWKGRKLSHSLP